MGRTLTEQRMLNSSVTKTIGYTYNLDGSLKTLVYPSGRTVTYTQGTAGRPLAVQDLGQNINYVTSATYAPQGSLAGMTNGLVTGTLNGIITTNTYNKRLQPITLSAATTGTGGQTVLSLSYDFHLGNSDNGNVFQIVNNRDNNRTQNFTYDSLNRIASAYTTSNLWGNTYLIDAWANLLQKNGVAGKNQGEGLTQTVNTKNQFIGFCYDIAGNMLGYGGCPPPGLPYTPMYFYDAENRLRTMYGASTTPAWYTYDGDGKRVIKTAQSENRLYWTGTGSDTLTETDLSGTPTADYIYFNGKRVARLDTPSGSGTVRYYFSDHLGSASVVTDNRGVIKNESDYYPYGGERTIMSADSNRYKFTGKERDSESGLDEFGARYYSSSLGRFMIPDWAEKPTSVPYASFGNPQSLNLYSYVNNNPTTTVDPDGHCPDGICENISTMTPEQVDQRASDNSQAAVGFLKGAVNFSTSAMNAFITMGESTEGPIPQMQPSNGAQAVGMTVATLGLGVTSLLVDAPAASATAGTAEKATQLQINKAAGDAFRDEVAGSLKAAGRDVQKEVTKQTPFGARRVDIEVSHNGKTLGGIETKTGNSPYKASQRAKDTYLKQKGYRVNVVRKPKEQ